MSHVRKKFAHAGKQLFEDVDQWDALSKILANISPSFEIDRPIDLIDSINRFDFDFDPSTTAFQSIDIDRLQVVIDRFDRRSPNSSGVLG
ncbi:hypothetical protein QL093DRAFT_1462265 [Fusarium oxysporum]|nr:hypothetical protein QL093DRAFT_1462265 [Fusarium oxysporum]